MDYAALQLTIAGMSATIFAIIGGFLLAATLSSRRELRQLNWDQEQARRAIDAFDARLAVLTTVPRDQPGATDELRAAAAAFQARTDAIHLRGGAAIDVLKVRELCLLPLGWSAIVAWSALHAVLSLQEVRDRGIAERSLLFMSLEFLAFFVLLALAQGVVPGDRPNLNSS